MLTVGSLFAGKSIGVVTENDMPTSHEIHRKPFQLNMTILMGSSRREDGKVAFAVITFQAVDMVDHFSLADFATQHLLCYQNMFWRIGHGSRFVRCSQHNIAPLIDKPPPAPQFAGMSGLPQLGASPLFSSPAQCLVCYIKRPSNTAKRFTLSQSRLNYLLCDSFHTMFLPAR